MRRFLNSSALFTACQPLPSLDSGGRLPPGFYVRKDPRIH
jgi:hypothetical protein